MLDQIAFIARPASDMRRAVDFYRNVLGLTLLFERGDWSEFNAGGMRLALYQEKHPGPREDLPAVFFTARPIEKILAGLERQGVTLDGELEIHPYGKLARFFDTEGNRLGLYEPPPGKTSP